MNNKRSSTKPEQGSFHKKQRGSQNEKAMKTADDRLKNFRRASVLAVSITGILILFFSFSGNDDVSGAHTLESFSSDDNLSQNDTVNQQDQKSTEEAIGTLQNLWQDFVYIAPKLMVAFGVIILSWLIIWLIRFIMKRSLHRVLSSEGLITIVSIAFWILVIAIVFSIITGDLRALVGSIGLVGLALSWALQTPIESFTGWFLNAFNHYYRIGDRIKVGEVFGDVYKIDYLTTTIWEIGSPSKAGYVSAEQPTGRLVTFPNNEILAGSIVNLTGDFPYVWDELVISITNESDINQAVEVLKEVSDEIVGEYMKQPLLQYEKILQKANLSSDLADAPQVYILPGDFWIDLTIRYLVGARERRKWKTKLFLHIIEILSLEENKKAIFPVYPRYQVQLISEQGDYVI